MDELVGSLEGSSQYPKNLVCHHVYPHVLDCYISRLTDQEKNLFCAEHRVIIDFWQFDHVGQGFWDKRVHNAVELREQLRLGAMPQRHDPRCRFIFLHAPHSRERLNISRMMFLSILSYHQVMPSFLDFVFSYGRQQHAQDFHFSGLRHESRLASADRGLKVPELNRSGRRVQLCYSLRAVESSRSQPRWPWSVRQTAIYHSYDLETGQSTWIVVKGDQLMKDRVTSATKAPNIKDLARFGTLPDCFSSALATHLLFCDWSSENWRWYINFLEEQVQDITRRTVDVTVSKPLDPISAVAPFSGTIKPLSRMTRKARTFTFGRTFTFSRRSTRLRQPMPILMSAIQPVPPDDSGSPQEPPESPNRKDDNNNDDDDDDDDDENEGFSFGDLQRIEFIEEKANETLLVLKTNTNVLRELKDYYRSVMQSEDCPQILRQQCKASCARFESRIESVQHDLQLQYSRLETLLRLVVDRKTLLYGILQFRSMKASKMLAERAQKSAEEVEKMTRNMHEIAVKTKQETVSMKIITLVTLFFLPGTYISTLMSTPIVQFPTSPITNKPQKSFSWPALQLYLAITLPLMFFTFVAWALFYWWVNWRETLQKFKAKALNADSNV